MNTYARTADTYLAQRVLAASPEQQAALLMEVGQLFLGKAIRAMEQKDHRQTAKSLSKVTEVITEAVVRLNHEDGGELVDNLMRIYDWWTREIFDAGSTKDTAKLEMVSHHMGEIRQAWEQLHEKKSRMSQASGFQLSNQVV